MSLGLEKVADVAAYETLGKTNNLVHQRGFDVMVSAVFRDETLQLGHLDLVFELALETSEHEQA